VSVAHRRPAGQRAGRIMSAPMSALSGPRQWSRRSWSSGFLDWRRPCGRRAAGQGGAPAAKRGRTTLTCGAPAIIERRGSRRMGPCQGVSRPQPGPSSRSPPSTTCSLPQARGRPGPASL